MKKLLTIMAFLLALLPVEAKAKYSVGTFEAGKGCFMLNGKPFVVKAAELHYPRIPRPYWEHRIKMCKALGMNTICIYIFWNKHEQEEGKFDWTGKENRFTADRHFKECHRGTLQTVKENEVWLSH